ncbi:MAG: FKBP-type peptidyl-prolyl cis-trans isomerase [Chitinophagales bacterium]
MKKYLLLLLIPLALFSCKKSSTDYTKIDREIIRKYIADSSLVADSTESGLFYVISDSGAVKRPNVNSYLTVNYKGYLTNGRIFDQTEGSPIPFLLSGTIKGWQEGIPLIQKGGKIKLLIPSALGYGDQEKIGTKASIPANSVLIFDIELVDFI